MFNSGSSRITGVAISIIILLVSGVALSPRLTDVFLAYDYVTGQILGDVAILDAESLSSQNAQKEFSDAELKKSLLSVDTAARLTAIDKIVEKKDSSFIPLLVKLFNDSTPAESSTGPETLTISDTARVAITKLTRDVIISSPENLRNLIPLFESTSKGSRAEKLGVIEVLSELREPLALALLQDMAVDSSDIEISRKAGAALVHLRGQRELGSHFQKLSSQRASLLYLIAGLSLLLGFCLVWGIYRRSDFRLVGLGAIALAMNIGLAFLVNTEANRGGTISEESVRAAVSAKDSLAIRTMIYSENAQYPADSFVCQELARTCDIRVLEVLNGINQIEPDDLPNFRRLLDTSSRWVAARLIALNASKQCMEVMIASANPSHCLELVKVVNNLQVTNDGLERVLIMLSKRQFDECSQAASKSLSALKKKPVLGY